VISELLDGIDALHGGVLLEVMDKRFTLSASTGGLRGEGGDGLGQDRLCAGNV